SQNLAITISFQKEPEKLPANKQVARVILPDLSAVQSSGAGVEAGFEGEISGSCRWTAPLTSQLSTLSPPKNRTKPLTQQRPRRDIGTRKMSTGEYGKRDMRLGRSNIYLTRTVPSSAACKKHQSPASRTSKTANCRNVMR